MDGYIGGVLVVAGPDSGRRRAGSRSCQPIGSSSFLASVAAVFERAVIGFHGVVDVLLEHVRRAGREVQEADAAETVPALRAYMRRIKVTRRYFDTTPASDAAIQAELTRHPVLRLIPMQS
jgi:hypothetical protein